MVEVSRSGFLKKIPNTAFINKCTGADQYNYSVTWSITSIPTLQKQVLIY